MKTDTAHFTWNDRWASEAGRADWLKPDADVVELAAQLLSDGGTTRVLDMGCGVGRHALHLASLGFETHAVDMAEAGTAELARKAHEAGLDIATEIAPMTQLPYPDGYFDYVLAFNVIYHGDGKIVRGAVSEIARVLRPGGIYQGTMLTKRNVNFGRGTEIAPDTFVVESDDDKDHPHFYCNGAELLALFDGFEVMSLTSRTHQKPGSWHWHLVMQKNG
jgi:tellurite methyltransferase